MKNSGLISGIVITIIGLILIIGGIRISETIGIIIMIVYGIILLIIGVYMLINYKKEDEIEKINEKDKKVRI